MMWAPPCPENGLESGLPAFHSLLTAPALAGLLPCPDLNARHPPPFLAAHFPQRVDAPFRRSGDPRRVIGRGNDDGDPVCPARRPGTGTARPFTRSQHR